MATATKGWRITAQISQFRTAPRIRASRSLGRRRYFNTYSSRWKGSSSEIPDTTAEAAELASLEDLPADEGKSTKKKPISKKSLDEAFGDILQHHMRFNVPRELQIAPPFREMQMGKPKPGLLNMGEPLATEAENDPEFEEDDITSMAHGQLEQHRDFRHYARLAAWEMPLLTKMAKPFVPPNQKEVLRFRYTTYMGEEHPAEKKVVVEFCPDDMPDLTALQKDKLKKLAGVRYNPETEIIKMSCEMFETQAQNKRYLGDLVDTLLQEARDPTDTFEDVPLDTRHHLIKTKPKFPIEWRMTPERKAALEAERQQMALLDEQRLSEGAIVDGVRQIKGALARPSKAPRVPDAVMAKVGNSGKSERLRR